MRQGNDTSDSRGHPVVFMGDIKSLMDNDPELFLTKTYCAQCTERTERTV